LLHHCQFSESAIAAKSRFTSTPQKLSVHDPLVIKEDEWGVARMNMLNLNALILIATSYSFLFYSANFNIFNVASRFEK